jgi:hypothetical protein
VTLFSVKVSNPLNPLWQTFTELKDLFYDEKLGYFEYAKEMTVST